MGKKQVICDVDEESGELEIRGKYIPRTKRMYNGKFLLFYGENLVDLNKLTFGRIQILMKTEPDNLLRPSIHILRNISKVYEISLKTLKNDVIALQEGNIIVRVSKGVYMVNPYLFIRGNRANINELISVWNRLLIEDAAEKEAKKNAEIVRLKSEIAQEKTLNIAKNILNGDNDE